MTDISSDIPNSGHNVAVIGKKVNGNLIYMDPELGVLMEAPSSNFKIIMREVYSVVNKK